MINLKKETNKLVLTTDKKFDFQSKWNEIGFAKLGLELITEYTIEGYKNPVQVRLFKYLEDNKYYYYEVWYYSDWEESGIEDNHISQDEKSLILFETEISQKIVCKKDV